MSLTTEKTIITKLNRPGLRALAYLLMIVGVLWFQSKTDPLGLVEASDHLSGLLVSSVLSPFYGGSAHRGQDNIVVILYDQDYLDRLQQKWPIRLADHRRLLTRIAAAQPAAIFLDIFFTAQNDSRRREISAFYQALEHIDCADHSSLQSCAEEDQVPVVLASLLSEPDPEIRLRHDDNTIEINRPPRTALAEVNEMNHRYRLTDIVRNCDPAVSAYCFRPTAAYSLYQIWCRHPDRRYDDQCKFISKDQEHKEMYLQWGYAPTDAMREYYEMTGTLDENGKPVSCAKQSGGLLATSAEAITLLVKKLFNGDWRPRCLYHNHVGARYAQSASFKDLEELVKGKVVLVGTALDFQQDTIESHIHGYVPGVFWHAMALDNLIEYGDAFLRNMPNESAIPLQTLTAAIIFSIALFMILINDWTEARLAKRRTKRGKTGLSEKQQAKLALIRVVSGLTIILAMALLICLFWVARRYAPENWVGVAALLGLIGSGELVALRHFSAIRAAILLEAIQFYLQPVLAVSAGWARSLTDQRNGGNGKAPSTKTPNITAANMFNAGILGLIILMLISIFVAIACILFFVPIVYFSIRPHSTDEIYAIFTAVYLWLIWLSARHWWRLTREAHGKDLKLVKAFRKSCG